MTERRPQITVLDAGGQYCHLIARKVRELGVYADVRASETPADELRGRRGLMISGGPSSVYDPGSPTIDPRVLQLGAPVLGICYGQQLIAHVLGGPVEKGERGEYGVARLELSADYRSGGLFEGLRDGEQVWMSHRDVVRTAPRGFTVLGRTATCAVAAMADPVRRLHTVQFHPEVVHTRQGTEILSNFVFGICGCERDWDRSGRISEVEEQIRETAAGRNIFFFVSGGVDSTVAYTLCIRALGGHRVRGAYVDTGLMREGETDFVAGVFGRIGPGALSIEREAGRFLGALAGVCDPERKRHVIGQQFVDVQERILETGHYLDGDWVLGQGTIYPDTIESGGTKKADLIKTHHNRVAGIQQLIEAGRIVEPLAAFYKDEVREIGRLLGLPPELLDRHPFPGPGLAIRCLCAESEEAVVETSSGWLLPVRSVGVQGDSRSYRPALAIDALPRDEPELLHRVAATINREHGVNRVVARLASHAPLPAMGSHRGEISTERLERLRRADAIVRRLSRESGFDRQVWQFPVVQIPLGAGDRPDSIVLRPIESVDGMTAQTVIAPLALLEEISQELLRVEGVCAVFHDLTSKPPGTIEWE